MFANKAGARFHGISWAEAQDSPDVWSIQVETAEMAMYLWRLLKETFLSTDGFLSSLPAYASIVAAFASSILWLFPGWRVPKMNSLLQLMRNHPALIVMSLLMVSVVLASYSLYVKKKPEFATPDDLVSSVLQNKTFRLVDLARESVVIRGRVFENCDIYGPAVVLQVNCTVNGLTLDASPETCTIETTNEKVRGAIMLEACAIKNCRFYKISLIGNREQLAKIRIETPTKD